ncbi:glycosyltransferase [Falsiroseomonas tokyonensis]|uniref:Glycosyltransferase n=1 Tax=Falsiroseomonas tokyonensis TaxID=430521 RepID=A0ABV7BRN7_9PROT|nr:glycosyltransferase [Falsiroseomonas tokyonensis]MBU8536738.1 glycosyltransferase [Falsiroseomonas tokyonensis]
MTRADVRRPGRVLHVLKYYRPAFTGEGVFLERSSAVMQELAPELGHDLLVTHTPRPPQDPAACTTIGHVIYLSDHPLGTLRRQLRMAAWFLANLHRYRVVHVRTHADWYFVTYLLARLARRRLILSATLDDSLPVLINQYRPSLRRLAARGFRLFDGYVSISPKLDAETRGIAPAARCHLIPCGVSIPLAPPDGRARMRQNLGIGAEELVLLFVGGLGARKDPLFLVRALPRILAARPDTRLILVGPVLEEAHLEAIRGVIAARNLGDRVILAGEQRDPHPYFLAADILVFASHLEGFGTVVPEAMAHGLPVVVRHLPGVNDSFVLQDETGYLFDDEEGYVAAVTSLAADATLRARLGAEGRKLARGRFGMRGVAERYLAVYGTKLDPVAPEETRLGATASVLDRRFHAPLAPPADSPPLLITMVDAEEAFDWSGPFRRDAPDVASMSAQERAHRIFEKHGVVPLYLVDYPVATQEAGRAPLRELLADGACEIGAQMHPWVTPPFTEEVNERNSYAGNLPVDLELAKARCLTDALAEAFGEAPRIYRTGRFGAGPRTADILKSLGYLADSSVTPHWPAGGVTGGPAGNWAFSAKPYWTDRDRTLLEIPVSAALVGHLAGTRAEGLAPQIFGRGGERLRLGGALARFGLLERIRLSPEGMTLEEAKRLTRHMLAQGHRSFVLTYHSPSLAPGNTPYVRDAAQLARFLGWLDDYYAFFREEVGGRFGSWRDLRGVAPAGRATATVAA